MVNVVLGTVRSSLLWFALAAPIGALLTYALLSVSGSLATKTLALLLVFSGGTFLYVSAVHILPEYTTSTMRRTEVVMLIIGVLLPVMPSLLHLGHGH